MAAFRRRQLTLASPVRLVLFSWVYTSRVMRLPAGIWKIDVVMKKLIRDNRPGGKSLVLIVGIGFVLLSSLQRFPVAIGGANVYFPHLLAVALFPLVLFSEAIAAKMRAVMFCFAALAVVVVVPSFALPAVDVRTSFLLQILLNSFTLIASFALFRQLRCDELRILVNVCSLLLVGGAGVQLFVAPGMNGRGETTFGLVHPILYFNEETWLALFASLLSIAAFGLGARRTGFWLSFLVFFIGTRSAMIVCGVALIMSLEAVAAYKWFRVVCVAAPVAFATWFVIDAVFATSDRVYNDSLDTRTADISAVRQANNDDFLPFGGEILSVFDFSRSRLVPATSNVQVFELYWKFGIGGLLVAAFFALLIAWVLPRASMQGKGVAAWPVWIPLMIWPAMLQFNNAFGFAWMWVLLALCLAVLAARQQSGDDGMGTEGISRVSSRKFQRHSIDFHRTWR